ncbi:MAG: NAD kinase [Pseudobdellovibrionaceae bacterium]
MTAPRIHFWGSEAEKAQEVLKNLSEKFGQSEVENADVVVAIGGDGTLLEALRKTESHRLPIYGINRGSVGFLMNEVDPVLNLLERLEKAQQVAIHPLTMTATDMTGAAHTGAAFNEVSLLRQEHQAAKIRIIVDDTVRLDELICDGALVATAAGSTAYNYSAHGPIIPLGSPVLALTPISAFRPRRWRGALLPDTARIRFEILDASNRPVSATADNVEVRNIIHVDIAKSPVTRTILFDEGHSLEERILREQFSW